MSIHDGSLGRLWGTKECHRRLLLYASGVVGFVRNLAGGSLRGRHKDRIVTDLFHGQSLIGCVGGAWAELVGCDCSGSGLTLDPRFSPSSW